MLLLCFLKQQLKKTFSKDFKYLFLERGEEKEKGVTETSIGCLSHTPNWGPGLPPRHVP